MTDQKRCVQCQRAIDEISIICPFCNWDQARPAPPPEVRAAPSAAAALYKPPEELRLRKVLLVAAGIVAMLVGSFAIGMVINSDGAPKKAPDSLEQQAAQYNAEIQKPRRADTPLVAAGQGGIEQQPITSAPVLAPEGSLPDEYQRTDATAVSAAEYAQMAKRVQAEKKEKAAGLIDPLSISGPAYTQPRMPPRPRSASTPDPGSSSSERTVARVRRTRPIPEYQPVPRIQGHGSARLTLLVGADGRVRDVNIERALPGGNTPALIGAVQRWRFKPATENGRPVAAPYSVEISFDRE